MTSPSLVLGHLFYTSTCEKSSSQSPFSIPVTFQTPVECYFCLCTRKKLGSFKITDSFSSDSILSGISEIFPIDWPCPLSPSFLHILLFLHTITFLFTSLLLLQVYPNFKVLHSDLFFYRVSLDHSTHSGYIHYHL